MKLHLCWAVVALPVVSLAVSVSYAEVRITSARNDGSASAEFLFENVPSPSRSDAASQARFTVVDGRPDGNGGGVEKLYDGKVPTEEDQPAENFFFRAGTDGGRLRIDLGRATDVKQVNTYSWHPGSRGPQVYDLYGSDGKADGFDAAPGRGTDPLACGWKLIAKVDTRPEGRAEGGQYGVSIADSDGTLGTYQYLLLDVFRTETADPFGNTFYSEIDVVDRTSPVVSAKPAVEPVGEIRRQVVEIEAGKYQITIDTTEAPDLTKWAHDELAPVVKRWYPKLVGMLPSDGYAAPTRVSITFSADMQGVAATSGTRVRCAARWFRGQLQNEAKGAIVHELVHVVQNYGLARRNNPNATRTPGWLVEGICDYIRWFLYEPHSHGAEISARNLDRARYDGSYRITANFLRWVSETHDKDIVCKLNAAAREGRYAEDLWVEYTGKSVQQLDREWKAALGEKAAAEVAAPRPNTLTNEEIAAGWKLLFNGENLDGWRNFKSQEIRPGWQVRDGALVCADPRNAGDLCTDEKFDWFELTLEYDISPAGNSGIMYHVTNEGAAAWATGPEFQLEDNKEAADSIRCGWLYGLYQPPIDPDTGQPLDATKRPGQWNQIRLLVTPERCAHEINGVRYFEYVLGSEDFKDRVAKSKFGRMPLFARSNSGYIALQGDHGQVVFRNIKIRPITTAR